MADGADDSSLQIVQESLLNEGCIVEIISPKLGFVMSKNDEQIAVDKSFLTAESVLYDAEYVPGGTNSIATLEAEADAVHFLNQAFKHCKPIAANAEALQVLESTYFYKKLPSKFTEETVLMEGVVISNDAPSLAKHFMEAIAQHRFWEREKSRKVPA